VIQDPLADIRAVVPARMTCPGFSPDIDGAQLRREGALPFASMFALPDLLCGLLQET
jgi:hypothetical protein